MGCIAHRKWYLDVSETGGHRKVWLFQLGQWWDFKRFSLLYSEKPICSCASMKNVCAELVCYSFSLPAWNVQKLRPAKMVSMILRQHFTQSPNGKQERDSWVEHTEHTDTHPSTIPKKQWNANHSLWESPARNRTVVASVLCRCWKMLWQRSVASATWPQDGGLGRWSCLISCEVPCRSNSRRWSMWKTRTKSLEAGG